jgi:hypothetical protein
MKTGVVEGDYRGVARHSTTLGMAGHACSFRTDSERFLELASAFFPLCPAPVAQSSRATITLLVRGKRQASPAHCNFPIFRGRNQFVHADYGSDGSVWFDLKAREVAGMLSDGIIADEGFFRRAVLSVIAGILAPSLGVIALHAACVVRKGKALLLAAPSGVGKSTISLALALRGWSLLSDDWTFVTDARNRLNVWGMQTSIKLLPDAKFYFPQLSALSPATSLNGELSFEVDPWTFFGVERAIDATPAGIVFLNRASVESNEHIFHISSSNEDEALESLLGEIEEQPEAIAGQNSHRSSLLQQLCRLPSLKVLFSGHPAVVAAHLDVICTERICA